MVSLKQYEKQVALAMNAFVKKYGYKKILSYSEIREILYANLGKISEEFQESNFCYNYVNKSKFLSFRKDVHLFENVGKGRYRILGENYPYIGEIIWKTHKKQKFVVGVWDLGDLNYWGDMSNFDDEDDKEYAFHFYKVKGIYRKQENKIEKNMICLLDEYLTRRGIVDLKNQKNAVIDRQRGKIFSFEEHLKGLIYALLSNHTEWSLKEKKLPQIDRLFFNYNVFEIEKHSAVYFERGIRKIKCGNVSIKRQMAYLHNNIKTLKKIERDYGSLDRFVLSDKPEKIVNKLAQPNSKYKLNNIGTSLAWEYLRNVGINVSKPDVHMKRFFGSQRIGMSRTLEASEKEVIKAVEKLSKESGYTKFEVDYLIWCYCASNKGEVCTQTPHCYKCVIREYCNYTKKGR